MLTLITKVVSDDSLRSKIDKSIHNGTYFFGGALKKYAEKLSLKAYLNENIVYISFPKKDESLPEVSYSTVVRECTKEEAADNDRLSWGDDVFEAGGKVYPVGFISYNAYPCGDRWLVYSGKHKKWIDVSALYEEDKRVRADKFVLDASVLKKYAIVKWMYRVHQKMTRKIYKFLHTLDSCYLCLKYPFLYPRNRITGQHYNNWKIMNYATRLQKESVTNIRMKIFDDDSRNIRVDKFPEISTRYLDEVPKRPKGKDTVYYCVVDGREVVLYDPQYGDLPLVHKTADDSEYSKGDYVYVPSKGWLRFGDYEMASAPVDFDHDGYKMRYMNIIVDPAKYMKYKVVRWAHDNILGRIFFIPTYSEIDNMDTGWFRAFGMKMLDEIKAQLKKDGMLYKYRIMQVKEKFGALRWYDGGATKELFNIIEKYSAESKRTCIVCGQPADYITSGYILPLCKNHINKKSIATAEDLHAPKAEAEEDSETE